MTSTTVKPSTRGACIGFCVGGRYTVQMAVSSDHLELAAHLDWQQIVPFLSRSLQEA